LLFYLFLKLLQIHLICSNNVHILITKLIIVWRGRQAGIHTGFRTITLVLYMGSLPNLATGFPRGRGRTLFILGSIPLYGLIIYIDRRILWCTHFLYLDLWPNDPKINRVFPLPQGNHVAKFVKIQYTELKLSCGNGPVVKNYILCSICHIRVKKSWSFFFYWIHIFQAS
jgi:hypothetical protein